MRRSEAKSSRLGFRAAGALAAVPLLVSLVLAGCGSSSPGSGSGSSGNGAGSGSSAVALTCQQVGDVLADGPDPDADPIGYAEAQIGPLKQVNTSDASLRSAIQALDAAYTAEFHENASPSTKKAVKSAEKQMNGLCPGVAP